MASGRHRSFGPGWPESTKGGFDALDTDDPADDEMAEKAASWILSAGRRP
jgi:hypothetical protein